MNRLFSHWLLFCFFLIAVGLDVPSLVAAEQSEWAVKLRQRVKSENGKSLKLVKTETTWDPQQTAIIVVDMWDDHHCKSAAERVVEVAPRMNAVLKAAREKGIFIIHSPSNCMDFYKQDAARKRAEATKFVKVGTKFQWNYFNPKVEGPLASHLEKAGCSCDTAEPCGPDKRVWKRQIDLLEVAEEDAVSDNGQEVYNLMDDRGIENVIVMGVHTNRCVLGRPFGIRQMVYLGKNVTICRDLTDSYHRDPGKHFEGLNKIIAHIEAYWCPSITSKSITGKPRFHFAADKTGSD